MEDRDYTKYSRIKRMLRSQWYEGDDFGNIVSFFWVEEELIAIVQNCDGDLVELIISTI